MAKMTKQELVDLMHNIASDETPADAEEHQELAAMAKLRVEEIRQATSAEIAEVQQAFNNTKRELQKQSAKNTMISLRINENDLTVLKRKASRYGLKYQTYINMILHQIVTDRLVDDFKLVLRTGTDNK